MSNISLVVNELLACVFHKYNSDLIEAIQSDVSRFYCDSNQKASHFIGQFNKLYSNFGYLQANVLSNLFKSYCCSFYGSFLWLYNSNGFKKCCKQWNKAIRKIFSLPYQSHRWLLGPLIGQYHISNQLIRRDIKCLYYRMINCPNAIIRQCILNAYHNANSLIGFKLAYFRSSFGVH